MSLLDVKKDALIKCEATHKIKIPKKGKVPKAVTAAIANDCSKELAAIKVAHVPYEAADKEYTLESDLYKKKYGGDGAALFFGVCFGVVCIFGFIACKIK